MKNIIIHEKGQDHISSFTKQLHDFSIYTMAKFQCYILFKEIGPNVPIKLDHIIQFFIPENHPQLDEIIKFIEVEWENKVMDGEQHSDHYMFGTQVQIFKTKPDVFIPMYLERKETEKLLAPYIKYFVDSGFRKLIDEANTIIGGKP